MSKSPAFQFYPTDFLGDKNVAPMEADEVGAYWLLCCFAWQETPRGTLPNDEKLLQKWSRLSVKKWEQKREVILKCFLEKNGRLYQKRLIKEAKKQRETAVKRQQAANKRWGCKSNASALQKHCSPTPTPTPTPNKKTKALVGKVEELKELKSNVGLVVGRLNEKAGKSFSVKGKQSEFILARLKEGATIEQCFAVIDRKVQQWQGTDHAIYLRPATLFNATKFEAYLNEPATKALSGTDASLKRRAEDCYQNDPEKGNPNSCKNPYQKKEVCRYCPKKALVKV